MGEPRENPKSDQVSHICRFYPYLYGLPPRCEVCGVPQHEEETVRFEEIKGLGAYLPTRTVKGDEFFGTDRTIPAVRLAAGGEIKLDGVFSRLRRMAHACRNIWKGWD